MRRLACLPFLVATACTGFAPVEGTWTTQNGDFTDDTCQLFSESDTDEPPTVQQAIAVVDDVTFTSTNHLDQVWTCTLDGQDFTCPKVLVEEEPVDGMDAELPLNVRVTGSFADKRTLTGVLYFEMSCTGDDCPGVEAYLGVTFPCTAQRTMDATADE